MDAITVLRRAASRVTHKHARRLLEIVAMLERAPAERHDAIRAAASCLYPALKPIAPKYAESVLAFAIPPAYRGASPNIQARLVLGETPAQISDGLTRREAHAWLTRDPWRTPAQWLLREHGIPDTVQPRSVPVARWILAVMADPQRRAALERERCERGPHGEAIRGRLLDRVDELIPRDLQPSVEGTYRRAGERRWKQTEKLLARKREPLAKPPRWWRPVRCARLLLSAADLIVEGKQMSHCVASYAHYVAKGDCVIVALNVCGRRSTVEMSRDGRILQHRGAFNYDPPPLCIAAITTLRRKWRLET